MGGQVDAGERSLMGDEDCADADAARQCLQRNI